MSKPELIDHIGWDLWQAAHLWKAALDAGMVARGHPVFAEARGALIRHIGSDGISQVALANKAGISKQAVQQHLDELAQEGYVTRSVDPRDARKKQITLTAKGDALSEIANEVKLDIESHYTALVGEAGFAQLKAALAAIIADNTATSD